MGSLRLRIYALPNKTILGIMLAAILLWTVLGICIQIKGGKSQRVWRILNAVLACFFVYVILRYTVFARTHDRTDALPFIRTWEQIKNSRGLREEMVLNVFLFFPLGLTMPHSLRNNSNALFRPVLLTILASFILTCGVEFVQYICRSGDTELSDIVMNTLGAVIGCLSYLFVRRTNTSDNNK